MTADRRTVLAGAGLAAGFGAAGMTHETRAATAAAKTAGGPDTRPVIAMLAYPGMFALDLVAPHAIFGTLGTHRVLTVWKTRDLVAASGLEIRPGATLADCPADLDVLFVPGGAFGTLAMAEDPDVLAFLADRGARARYVTSVCTGSLVLAAAGLLQKRRATSHWLARERLSQLGAIPVESRVVQDGNRLTGAGVTAGSDLALTLAAELSGEKLAKAAQLVVEYDPSPPFKAGSPHRAGAEITRFVQAQYAPFTAKMDEVLPRVRQRLGLA